MPTLSVNLDMCVLLGRLHLSLLSPALLNTAVFPNIPNFQEPVAVFP